MYDEADKAKLDAAIALAGAPQRGIWWASPYGFCADPIICCTTCCYPCGKLGEVKPKFHVAFLSSRVRVRIYAHQEFFCFQC